MRTLLDTCVVSELARAGGEKRVKECVSAIRNRDLFLSVITIGEIAKGIALLDSGRRKNTYSEFLQGLEQDYGSRILPLDFETALIWGELSAAGRKSGKPVSASDGLIAATGIRHGLRVMTRNVSVFAETGARIYNPWEEA